MRFLTARHGPIAAVEQRHQRGVSGRVRPWQRWARRALYLLLLEVALILYFGELIGALLWRDTSAIARALGVLVLVLLMVTVIYHGSLLVRILLSSASSITREKSNGRWEPLLMTGVDARALALGKWWGTLLAHRRELLLLLPLRVGLAVYLGVQSSRVLFPYVGTYAAGLELVPPNPLGLLAVVPLVAVFTAAGAALSAAVGLAASAAIRHGFAAVAAGFVAALLVVLGVVGLLTPVQVAFSQRFDGDPGLYERNTIVGSALSTVQVTWLDNGTLLTSALSQYEMRYPEIGGMPAVPVRGAGTDRREALAFVLGLGLSLALYALLTWLALELAVYFLRRRGVLPGRRA